MHKLSPAYYLKIPPVPVISAKYLNKFLDTFLYSIINWLKDIINPQMLKKKELEICYACMYLARYFYVLSFYSMIMVYCYYVDGEYDGRLHTMAPSQNNVRPINTCRLIVDTHTQYVSKIHAPIHLMMRQNCIFYEKY